MEDSEKPRIRLPNQLDETSRGSDDSEESEAKVVNEEVEGHLVKRKSLKVGSPSKNLY